MRRDIARMQRLRAVFFFTFRLLLIVGLVTGAYLGGKECLRRFLWENPDYFLAELRLNTDGALTHEQVRTTAGIEIGRNIFTVDLAAAREALDKLPQVERVTLQRVLPNRIDVNITERQPIAWVAEKVDDEHPSVSENSFLVDSRGVAMRIKAKLPEYLSLPVIAGVSSENVVLGQRVRSYEMLAALDLIRLNKDNTRFHPRLLDISKGYCVIVSDQLHRKFIFRLDGIDRQVARLMRLLDFSEKDGRQIQQVNLFVERNTPVLFAKTEQEIADAAALSAGATPPSKDSKGRPISSLKKGETQPAPASTPANNSPKSSTPPHRSNGPADSVKKPFRLNG